jgi:hypothetical protein
MLDLLKQWAILRLKQRLECSIQWYVSACSFLQRLRHLMIPLLLELSYLFFGRLRMQIITHGTFSDIILNASLFEQPRSSMEWC